ncbi:hypothetical protein H311_01408 [Anncaliia algerae PRA109]|nr:hypothetical protein H311_01408 [Anncaliia algerae PRA109]
MDRERRRDNSHRRNDDYSRRHDDYNRRHDDYNRNDDYYRRDRRDFRNDIRYKSMNKHIQRDRRYNEEPIYSRNYRENSLHPREYRGYRDERNYRFSNRPRMPYNPRGSRMMSDRRFEGFMNEGIPSRHDMDQMLKTYLENKE